MTWQIGTSTPSATTRRTATYTPTATIDPLSCLPALDNSQYAQVKRVQDGETIIVDIADGIYSVRYLGIQTSGYRPIIAENGPDALRANIALVSDQIVQLIPDGMDKNASGQLLRYVVLVGSHRFVNYELARLGYARAAPDISSLMCGKMLARAETLARQDQLGIWSPTLTPRPSRTPTPTRTSRPTTTLKPTDNLTQTAIFLLTHTATATLTATSTPTATITITPTITPTGTLTSTLTATPTGSLTPSPNPSVTVAGTLTTQP